MEYLRPTETTVCSVLQISNNDNPITIGRPIANTQIYLLNKATGIVNIGEIGEIAIAGAGVSLGYLNRPELTSNALLSIHFKR
jgi:non-ribosomal peptide synthetase component F